MRLIASFAWLALAFAAHAQAAEKPLFASNDAIHLAIQAPLSQLIKNREFEGKIAGTLTDPAGQALPINLSLRGITRRTSEICEFPPLRVDFVTPPPANSVFAGQKRLKLITHCRNTTAFTQYVLLEYSAYRMYNLLTPRSFRAKLATINYRDDNGRPIASQVGFFLEDLDDVADRNGTRKVKAGERIPFTVLSPPDSARYAIFQHMIGNHDWSMRAGPVGKDCCHNAEIIGTLTPGGAIPIPYDFDYSGFVGAPYAVPPAQMSLSNVRQRFYRGFCAHSPQALVAARQFRAAQPQMLAVLAQTPGLEPRTQQRAASFLNGFFADIATDADVSAKVLKRCAA